MRDMVLYLGDQEVEDLVEGNIEARYPETKQQIKELMHEARREILQLSGILLEIGDTETATILMHRFGFPIPDTGIDYD